MPYTLVRATSLAITLLLARLLSSNAFWWVFFYLLFTHYFLSFIYSKKTILTSIQTIPGTMVLGSTLCLGLLASSIQFPPMPLYFAFHCAFSDSYLIKKASRPHFYAQLLFNLSTYYALLKPLPELQWQYQNLFYQLAVFSFVAFIFLHIQLRRIIPIKEWLDILTYETLLLALLFYFQNSLIEFRQLIFYHLVTWILIPWKTKGVPLKKQVTEHVLGMSIFALIFYPLSFYQVNSLSMFWGYMHVTSYVFRLDSIYCLSIFLYWLLAAVRP